MKSRLEIQRCLGSVAFLATNFRFPRFEFSLVKDIFPLIIPMVTLLAREVCFHVTGMGKRDRRSFSLRKGGAFQRHGVWLSPQSLSEGKEEDGHRKRDEKSLLFHSYHILSGSGKAPDNNREKKSASV